jgi:hypothetical protein
LRLAIAGVACGCPARGNGVHNYAIRLGDLLALSAPLRRVRQIQIEKAIEHIAINGIPMGGS